MNDKQQHPASFRDPAGYIFRKDGLVYRQVNNIFAEHFQQLQQSGLYDALVAEKKLLPHTVIDTNFTGDEQWYTTLLPQQLEIISYPYEWCFSQWQDAALLTLELLDKAISYGMVLKDATPFNIQFVQGAPVFIDTLSFEIYDATQPWVAYRQFAECFIAPLLLARYRSPGILKMFQLYPQGIPLSLLAKMLPFKARLNMNVLLHVFLPASIKPLAQTSHGRTAFTKQKLLHIVHGLQSFVKSLHVPATKTNWNHYYDETILSNEYVNEKKRIVGAWLKELPAATVLDLGTNTGLFAEMAAAEGKFVIATDADEYCIDALYQQCRQKKISNILPLYTDIANPAPAIGWNNKERDAFLNRMKPGLTMALALVHHLAIGNNLGFDQLAALFSSLSEWLIIEFVPKGDPRVQQLLQSRKDIFTNYDEQCFLTAFGEKFTMEKQQGIPGTLRTLFLMKRR